MLSVDEIKPDCPNPELAATGKLHFVVYECLSVATASHPKTVLHDEVHLWNADVSGIKFDERTLGNLLSADELERMNRFHFEADQQNFFFYRTMLRILLASYLGTPPAELRFAYSAHGKPSLADSAGKIEFNLSHSESQLLIAICRGRKIGVDIEKTDLDLQVMEVAQRFFSPAELRALESEPPQSRHQLFYSCWTQKEAWLKARGDGLSFSLSAFDVCGRREPGEVTLVTRPSSSEALKWGIFRITAPQGFSAAVAVERQASC
jgi:4'-phosphopantetheinyl transferase